MQTVEAYTYKPFEWIKERISQGWKVIAMTSIVDYVNSFGNSYENTTIVVYEKPDNA